MGAIYFLSIKGIILSVLCEAKWERGNINVQPRLSSENFVFISYCYKPLCKSLDVRDDHNATLSDISNKKSHKAACMKIQNPDVRRVYNSAARLQSKYIFHYLLL